MKKEEENYLNVSEVEYLLSMFHVCAMPRAAGIVYYITKKTKVYKVTFHKQKGNEQEIYSIKTTTR